MSIRKLRAGRVPSVTRSQYIGESGTIFWDESSGVLYLSDGHTPGGIEIKNPAFAVSSVGTPASPFEGMLWFNPTTLELWAYHNGAFEGTINPATPTALGGIKAGPGVVVASDGTLSLDSTGIPFNFGDFISSTPLNGAATLKSKNLNQDIDIVSNGTGAINMIGDFHVHRTADYNPALPDTSTAVFAVKADGQVQMKVPLSDSTTAAFEVIGNDTGLFFTPTQTGVILHTTGNSGLIGRNYFDANANYALIVGRRYNGTQSAPTKVLAGEMFFRIAGQASTQTSTEPAVFQTFGPCQIDWVATEDQGPNNQGGELRFRATPNGSSSQAGITQVASMNATTGLTAIKFVGPLTGNVTGNADTATLASKATNMTSGVLGSVAYQSAVDTTLMVSPNTTTTRKFFRQTGTGSAGAAPAWDTVTAADVGLSSVTNESKVTMFSNPTFTGTVSGVTKAMVGLSAVENTALSTWAGSSNITTVGTLTSGSIGSGFTAIPNSALAHSTIVVNGVTLTLGDTNDTITAAAGTLTGTTLNATVVSSSLTSVGTLTSLAVGSGGLTVNDGVTVTGNIRYDIASNNATVTQLTDKTTTVICNGRTGQITTSNSSLAKGAAITFTVTNSAITAVTDVPVVVFQSGATTNSYSVSVTRVQVGSFNITISNNGTGALTDTIIINFAIIKVA